MSDVQSSFLELLRGQPDPLFVVLDAARDDRVLDLVLQANAEHQSLYEGLDGDSLAQVAPYLVSCERNWSFLESLVREGWGKSWGVYLTCASNFQRLRQHLRHFLEVTLPDGKNVYFRFYDPRVLRDFATGFNSQEAALFFGPVSRFLCEAASPNRLLELSPGPNGVVSAERELNKRQSS